MKSPWFGAHVLARIGKGYIPLLVTVPAGPDCAHRAAIVARITAPLFRRK